jgi:ABC-2 type transport system ATP-binding protein
MIEVQNLTKRYGTVNAISGVSFSAGRGVTGFLGPNGAGKTTTMRILTGFMPPTEGKATVAGYDVFDQSLEVRKRVGYLPENVPLYRDMTARDYLMYIGEIRGVRNRKARALEVLERVGLLHRANSRIRTLSKGMKQRVGLAQALVHNPPVLILDEPTIGLDPIQVLELRDLVSDLGRDHAVLFSTHILSEAEQVCDQLVIVNQGRVIKTGSPASLRAELERGGRVLARLEGNLEGALSVVQNTPGVKGAHLGLDGIVATPQEGVDPRPQIAQALIQGGHKLIELRPLAVNLEEIFLELTRQEQAASAAAEAEMIEAEVRMEAEGNTTTSEEQAT